MNDQFQKSQKKLYSWITNKEESSLTYTTVQLASKTLLKQYHPAIEGKKAWHYLFLPLVRSGVVFFCGKGKYTLSPAVQLNGKENNSLLINSFDLIEFPKNCAVNVGPGQYLLPKELVQNTENVIPIVQFSLSQLLKRIPPLKQIVTGNFQELIIPPRYRFKKEGSGWIGITTTRKTENGIYKIGENVFSPLYLVLEKRHFEIPLLLENPDAYTLANLVHQINQEPFISDINYDTQQQLLKIATPFFPIELEKLLYLNSVLANHFGEINREERTYNVPFFAFHQLNRIFNQKIQIR